MRRAKHAPALMCLFWFCGSADALPQYLNAWEARYPESTLPSRMASSAGSQCFLCHHLSNPGPDGANCYRGDIADLLGQGLTIAQALDQLDTADSDGDGTTNGVEILLAHNDLPGEVGYNPGLVGPFGTDPCAPDPFEVVSGQPETPPNAIPTVSAWGIVCLLLVLLTTGTVVFGRAQRGAINDLCA